MNYVYAKSVADCLVQLKAANGMGRIIAGGTDLYFTLRDGRVKAETLVDISRIPELKTITIENNQLVIGSAVTLNEIIKSDLVLQHAPIVAEAASCLASVQIRNIGTMVGNVVNACPEADCGIALAVLDTRFVVESEAGTKEVPVMEMFDEVTKTSIDSTKEVVTKVLIPLKKTPQACVYERFALRKAMAPVILNSAVYLALQDGKIATARICMGPVNPVISRAYKAEAFLQDQELSLENLKKAAALALEEANPLDNPFRGSAAYLRQVLNVLIERALIKAAGQLGANLQTA